MTNGNTETMEYNGLNQLVKKLDNGGSTGKTTYQYDGSGNQTGISVSCPGATYTDTQSYDPYNRLTAINRTYSDNSKVLLQKNTYNGDGQRVASTYTYGGNTTTEYYHYTEGQLSYVKDVAGTTTGKYIYNDEGGVLLREEKATSGTGKSYISYTKDIRGSAKTLISQTGKKFVSYDYNDYGETAVRTAADNTSKAGYNNHLCYTGGVYDKATGMYYLNARYYASSVAGFITQDSYRGTYEDPKTWNLYAYCAGNPVGYTDPTGHFWDTVLDIYGALDSIKNFIEDPSWGKGGLAVVDTLAAIVPIVPGTGGVKAVKAVVNVADDVTGAAKGAKKAGNAVEAITDTTKAVKNAGKINKIKSSLYKKGTDLIDIKKFTKKKKGKMSGYIEPKTGWWISKDTSKHGGSCWKLKNKAGERIASLDENGKILRK